MDGDRFDQLSRLLGQGVHRRAAVAALAALAVSGVEEATAKRKHKRHQRAGGGNGHGGPGGNSACAHFCDQVFGADTPEAAECISRAARGDTTSPCYQCGPAGGANPPQQRCGAQCIPRTACCVDGTPVPEGDPCDSSTTCCSGTCVVACPDCSTVCSGDNTTCCDTTCTNLNTDVNNCGRCGNYCDSDLSCVARQCACPLDTQHLCPGDRCVNLCSTSSDYAFRFQGCLAAIGECDFCTRDLSGICYGSLDTGTPCGRVDVPCLR